MDGCGITYNREENYEKLEVSIKSMYIRKQKGADISSLVSRLINTFTHNPDQFKKVTFSKAEDFYQDVEQCLKIIDADEEFRKIILNTFFDMTDVELTTSEEVTPLTTVDSQIENVDLDIEITNVFGIKNRLLINNLSKVLQKELVDLLVYDFNIHQPVLLNSEILNKKIRDYMQDKFNNLVDYLYINNIISKEKQKELKQGLYKTGIFNLVQYREVLNLFKKNLFVDNDAFNQQLAKKLSKNFREESSRKWEILLSKIEKEPELIQYLKNRQNKSLYYGNSYSALFNIIKKATLYGSRYEEIRNAIKEIEGISTIDYINNYLILSQFDSLTLLYFNDIFSIKKGFLKNIYPEYQNINKYEVKKSKKHQHASWQDLTEDGSEKHTGIVTKSILENLEVVHYKTKKSTNRNLSLTGVLLAFTALLNDILENQIEFQENVSLKLNITDIKNSPLDNIYAILRKLFNNTITGKNQLNDEYLSILYSYFHLVLDLKNPDSIYRKEILNNTFFPITNDLISILYRNVSNDYIDCSEGVFNIIRKFNYDSESFELVSLIQNASNKRQKSSNSRKYKLLKQLEDTGFNIEFDKNENISEIYLNINGRKLGFDSINIFSKGGKMIDLEFFDELKEKDFSDPIILKLFSLFDEYLQLNCLSEEGLRAMQLVKESHANSNYLSNFLRLTLSLMTIDYHVFNEMKLPLSDKYIINDPYLNLYKFIPGKIDTTLQSYVKQLQVAKGFNIKSTTKNKSGDPVSNSSISRLGSELYAELEEQKSSNIMNSLYFVNNPSAIKTIPVLDDEVTTYTLEVKKVKELSVSELFQHAIVNKFYLSYIENKQSCILPTVYSDKVTLLNYLVSHEQDINLYESITDTYIDKYNETIFKYYKNLSESILNKYRILFKKPDLTKLELREKLQTFTSEQLIEYVKTYNQTTSEPIELELDLDYRDLKTHCDINEIIEYYSDLHVSSTSLNQSAKDNIRQMFYKLQLLFIQDLKDNLVRFVVFPTKSSVNAFISSEENIKFSNDLLKILYKLIPLVEDRIHFVENWTKNGELILSKIEGKNKVLNPFLEHFFFMEGFYSNNLRLSLTGTESNHPNKSFDNIYIVTKNLVTAYNKEKNDSEEKIELEKKILKISKLYNIPFNQLIADFSKFKSINDLKTLNKYKILYEDAILNIINTTLGTLFKRNVIIPATLQHVTPGVINGPSDQVICCCIKDTKAPVHNLRQSDEIDSDDGSAPVSPIQMRLENNALGELQVGNNRKPIWHELSKSGSAFLAKFAAFGYNNALLKQNLNTNAFNMFKKMHNLRWNGSIDLTQLIHLDLNNWFNKYMLLYKNLYYKNQYDLIVEILDFGKDENGYYTIENKNKVYHYFDNISGEHQHLKTESNHTIDSLFELFTALGGINCVDSNGETSDFSLDVLTNFVINVGTRLDKKNPLYSASLIHLPLKQKYIAYAFNSSAVKNGAKNMNPKERWGDNKSLATFKLSIKGLGILLNAEHDSNLDELTEFSLVIAACAAYGKEFGFTSEIYYSLQQAALSESSKELRSLEEFIDKYSTSPEKTKYKLYKILELLILRSKSNNTLDLTESVKLYIKKHFDIAKDIAGKELKIPFSDVSIYNLFITNITSVINKKSIKRKHPGSGYVINPSFNIVMTYSIPDGKGNYLKGFFNDVYNNAIKEYRYYLRELTGNKFEISIDRLKKEVIKKGLIDDSKYSTIDTSDINKYKLEMVQKYLENLQYKEPSRSKSWFMPTDIVRIYPPNGDSYFLDLKDMSDFYNFKDTEFEEGTIFKLDLLNPTNLKPSLIRWLYYINPETGLPSNEPTDFTNYMTIYDHPIIKSSWIGETKHTQKDVLDMLDLLDLGKFIIDGKEYNIVPESLENTEAEVVMHNMYKDLFDTGNNSLYTILKEKENFFKKHAEQPSIPKGKFNLSFIKSNGEHTLITFDNSITEDFTIELPFDEEYFENWILHKGIKIGKWELEENWTILNGVVMNGDLEITKNYKIGEDGKIYRRVDFVNKYLQSKTALINGEKQTALYTLYKINYLNLEYIPEIIELLYNLEDYIDININTQYNLSDPNIAELVLYSLINLSKSNEHVKSILDLIENCFEDKTFNFDDFKLKYKEFNKKYYSEELLNNHKIYVSFLNSLRFISSRIPAQSLLSFMPMRCVGWVEGSGNSAYVSYILTWLQGSDYDIDKAYIMGQSFSKNKHYIKWSPLFRYNNDKTLQASKTLPVPKGYTLTQTDNNNYSIDLEINEILNSKLLHNLIIAKAKLIRKIDSLKGFYHISYDSEEIQQLLQEIQQHENYVISKNLLEQAFKNVASANIYNVVHAIRNRDLAYSPITMKDLLKEADKSPKGQYVKLLNMFNPLTKYIMLYLNLVGKNVIGIAANGEKVWFNLTYFYNYILRNRLNVSSILRLKKYDRIYNRSKGKPEEFISKSIPDLGQINEKLRIRLKEIFNQTDFEDKYVDLLISLLLSAATDNAKELILAKINSGTQTAKYYIHLIILGFSLDDIVAYMTSPVIELIDKYSANNYFLKQTNSIEDAVELLQGKIKLEDWLIPPKKSYELILDELESMSEGVSISPYDYVFDLLGENFNSELFSSILEFVKYYILVKTGLLKESKENEHILNIINFIQNYNVPETSSYDVNRLFDFIHQLINDIKTSKNYNPDDFILDIKQFNQLTEEANETTSLASVWLGLNQGLPLTDQDIIEKLHKMQQSISSRETKFFGKSENISNNTVLKKIVKKIQENNPMLDEEYIVSILQNAIDIGLYNNFDIKKYLSDENNYRLHASDYYNLIKSNWNILDIMNTIPHYRAILDLFNYTTSVRNLFSTKSNVLDTLMELVKHVKLSKKLYAQAVRYVDNMHVLAFTTSLFPIIKTHKPVITYDKNYKEIINNKIYLNNLAGIDSFRNFVETDFIDYLLSNYGHLQLVKDLIDYSYFGKTSIVTRLNLNDIENSLLNGLIFNQYLLDINTLSKEYYTDDIKVSDILLLYTLLMNGTRLGGKYLTALFTQLITDGTLLMKYYDYILKQDYNNNLSVLNSLINKEDFLLYIAPTVSSKYALKNRKEHFVKVANEKTGYDIYEKTHFGYSFRPLRIANLTSSELYKYRTNSIVPYPKLYKKLYTTSLWDIFSKTRDIESLKILILDSIKQGILTIYEECNGV